MACSQTFKAFADLAEYLLNNCEFEYVLLGNFAPIRLGDVSECTDNLAAEMFCISVKQLLDSERKIRILNVSHVRMLSSAISLSDDLNLDKKAIILPDFSWLLNDLGSLCVYQWTVSSNMMLMYMPVTILCRWLYWKEHCQRKEMPSISNIYFCWTRT